MEFGSQKKPTISDELLWRFLSCEVDLKPVKRETVIGTDGPREQAPFHQHLCKSPSWTWVFQDTCVYFIQEHMNPPRTSWAGHPSRDSPHPDEMGAWAVGMGISSEDLLYSSSSGVLRAQLLLGFSCLSSLVGAAFRNTCCRFRQSIFSPFLLGHCICYFCRFSHFGRKIQIGKGAQGCSR